MMFVTGQLIADPSSGLAIKKDDGSIRSVLWPFGWSAHSAQDGIVLLDRSGEIVGQVGSEVRLEGGHTLDHEFICD